jgi:hypothetical protein
MSRRTCDFPKGYSALLAGDRKTLTLYIATIMPEFVSCRDINVNRDPSEKGCRECSFVESSI